MEGSSEKTRSESVSVLPNYRIGRTLGCGTFAKVKLAQHVATGHKVAIKILNRSKIKKSGIETKVQREIKIMKLLNHPHIIRQYEVIETPENIYVVMEYVKHGELFDYIIVKGRLPEDEARHIFQQIISGVEYCHRNRIAHRDLKPENVLLHSKHSIKIGDFGLSNIMLDGHFLKTSCGSPNYAAPEVISGQPYSGPEVDIWSCGVILYALLCGNLPFDDENVHILFKKIKTGVYVLPDHVSPLARDLIPRMLMVDPLVRYSISEIRNHPWFNVHLPPYLATPPLDITEQSKKIDEEIVEKVVNIGFDRDQLIASLINRVQNEATVAYHIILDNQKRESVPSDHSQSMFKDISDGVWNIINSLQPAATFNSTFLVQEIDPSGALTGLRSQVTDNRNWTLGLRSNANPSEIMGDVFKALQNIQVRWKKIGSYNIKCRWVRKNQSNESNIGEDESALISPAIIKFELQLYKVSEGKYLLDIQRVDGPPFIFLELSFEFIKELGVF